MTTPSKPGGDPRRAPRRRSIPAVAAVVLASAVVAGCGGGGTTASANPGEPDPDPGSGGNDPGTIGSCGVVLAPGVTLPGPAEGAWSGAFPIFSGVDLVFGSGVIAADGTAAFSVANAELWVGSVLGLEDGAVASNLVRYERPNTGGAGGPRSVGTPIPEALAFDRAVARTTLGGAYRGPLSNCEGVSLRYDDVYERAASLQEIAGVFTASEQDGYTLTITVHDDGQLDGSDTRGCVLIGNVSVPDAARNVYRAVASASACGDLDGQYEGMLSLRLSKNHLSWLDLALVAPDTAIFYRLSR